ncbi:hypothetical protein B0181_09710 [Moraxella caviae]|uniref:Allophanate hydrolase subunit 2 n=1 Tax=Moraxella caviae TaxID=34060 RepID=A0A1S9ZWB5_9GAMM|nr:biotin-dependent carboxyltransferase family protein [Moraxella caviae]OOR87723.1 hypothetical protein B0181_09710 [Moraxella caviae]STZ10133.1 Allophanate hydrolase subunit 2 [Moraxella caviae]VEW11097.1 Allophanate hydrolase subunit 2 [Moraxella caviae]
MLKIISINATASVQDTGRVGFLGLGLGTAGAMDASSLQLGNALLGNELNAAALEITLGSLVATFTKDTTFCLTGAVFEGDLDGQKLINAQRTFAKQGQTLTLKRATLGMHGYLCVVGGFDVPTTLGSASDDVKTGIGAFGRTLTAGDELPYQQSHALATVGVANWRDLDSLLTTDKKPTHAIALLKSSEFDAFAGDITAQEYTLSTSSNRMGYRLDGEPIALHKPTEMLSHGVAAGMIQVPPDGKPIVLMADAQTTGGYPKIASVIQADLGRLAQVRFGEKVRFYWTDIETAYAKTAAMNARLERIQKLAKRL